MSYEQHIKHWKNHRKDRFTQQCAPPVTSSHDAKKDYDIETVSGVYIVTAYSARHAVEIFERYSPEEILGVMPHNHTRLM